MSDTVLPYPPCVCGHRYDRHNDHQPGIGCYQCECQKYRPAEVFGPKVVPSVPPPMFLTNIARPAAYACGVRLEKRSHAAWFAYHLALHRIWFEMEPTKDGAWEFVVREEHRELLRSTASAYFHDGKEL